jgi:hypothetical protein
VVPPRLLVMVAESTAVETVNVPVYLPPPPEDKVPIRAPVDAFHTDRVAVVFVLVASIRN